MVKSSAAQAGDTAGAVENLDLSLPGNRSRPRNVGLGAIAPEYHYLY